MNNPQIDYTSIKVMDPKDRMKLVTAQGDLFDIDPNIPARMYYRSGKEMVRMAAKYLDDGSLECAYILYIKFITLFLEKIRGHPDFNLVPPKEKQDNRQQLKEVIPKAENLKKKLYEQYRTENEHYLNDEKRREEATKAKKTLPEKIKKENTPSPSKEISKATPSSAPVDNFSKLHITPVPNITGELYPNDALELESRPVPPKPQQLSVSTPSVNRNAKPAYLLSPTVNLQNARLRTVVVPGNLIKQFTSLAQRNTDRNIETCGILGGQLRRDELLITHLLIPQQVGTSDACDTLGEEDLFDFQDQHDLITFGWIHTHPTQTAFLSSVDLHTHCSYQRMMPEAIAIVCAPRYSENKFFYLTPDYGLDFIVNCRKKGFHPHPTEPELYMVAGHVKLDNSYSVTLVDLRIHK